MIEEIQTRYQSGSRWGEKLVMESALTGLPTAPSFDGRPATTLLFGRYSTGEFRAVLSQFVWVSGSMFRAASGEDGVFIAHPSWSILGHGDNLAMAKRDLINEAIDLADDMKDASESDLTAEALDLKRFVERVADEHRPTRSR